MDNKSHIYTSMNMMNNRGIGYLDIFKVKTLLIISTLNIFYFTYLVDNYKVHDKRQLDIVWYQLEFLDFNKILKEFL